MPHDPLQRYVKQHAAEWAALPQACVDIEGVRQVSAYSHHSSAISVAGPDQSDKL